MIRRALVTTILLTAWLAAPLTLAADRLAIVNGEIWTMTGTTIKGGTVLIQDGVITGVGRSVRIPAGTPRLDARGATVLPGFIDSGTRLGLVEIGAVAVTRDSDEGTAPVTPHMRVIDGYNPLSELIPVARMNGITAVLATPGAGNLIAGQSALLRLDGEAVDDALIAAPAGMHVNLGDPPKSRWGDKNRLPSTRMGTAALLRQTLLDARAYREKLDRYAEKRRRHDAKRAAAEAEGDAPTEEAGDEESEETEPPEPPTPPKRDLKLEALLPVLAGELPAIVRAHRLDDILTAIRIAEEFGLRLILNHATEAYKVADLLAGKAIPVLVGPINTQPSSMETLGAIYENAARLHEAGVLIAIQTSDDHNVRNLPYAAGLAVAYGLPREAALAAITRNPARIFGVEDRLGTVEVGKEASLQVVAGDPLEITTEVQAVIIRGRRLPLTSRQWELYRRYADR